MHLKLAAARVRVMEVQGYLSAMLWKMTFREVPLAEWPTAGTMSLGRIATTERGVCYVRADTLDIYRTDELAADLVHEVMHLLLKHHARVGGRDRMLWNLAGDASINPDVLDVTDDRGQRPWTFRDGGFMPAHIPAADGLTADAYYDLLAASARKVSVSGCCGSAAGAPHPVEGPAGPDDPEAVELEVASLAVAAAVRQAARSRQRLPRGLDRWAEAALEETPVDWRRVLAGAVRSELRAAGSWDYTYLRPSRRGRTDIVIPALRAPRIRAAVVVDTSASRDAADLEADVADIKGVLKASGTSEINLVACDTEVRSAGRVRSARQAGRALAGGGGTTLGPGIAAASKPVRGEKPDVVVVLTDGENSDWSEPVRGVRYVVIVPAGAPGTPGWMRRVEKPRD